MEETAAAGDDGSGFERRLVNLHCEVESRKWFLIVLEVMLEELVFIFREHLLVLPQSDPVPQHIFDSFSVETGLSRSQLTVCGGVAKMIAEGQANVAIALNDSRAEVFVTLCNDKLLLVAEEVESSGLVWEQILRASAAAVELLECFAEFRQAECDGRWERKDPRRHPLGPDVKTWIEVIVRRIQLSRHERLDLEVAVKAWEGGGFKVVPGDGGFRIRNKVKAESEE